MLLQISQIDLKEILQLRALFLSENNFQIRYNACHERGWTNSYVIVQNGTKIGYASIKGNESVKDRDTVFEFYLLPPFRNLSVDAFTRVLQASSSSFIETQTNEPNLTSLLFQFGKDIQPGPILFEESLQTSLKAKGVLFRKRRDEDSLFEHKSEPPGDYVLEINREIVASGGFLLHYNLPFADLYMEVKEEFRRKGLGSYLVQETKTQCYLAGRVPAARCDIDNTASWATLLKSGFKIAGYMLMGHVR
jgi:GNAT superfamily N-acetyltransferase